MLEDTPASLAVNTPQMNYLSTIPNLETMETGARTEMSATTTQMLLMIWMEMLAKLLVTVHKELTTIYMAYGAQASEIANVIS